MSDLPESPDPLPCTICGALVRRTHVAEHREWHEQLVDEIVSAVKVRMADPGGE